MPEKKSEISASSWFYHKEICYDARSRVTMHGHMNVKYVMKCSVFISIVCKVLKLTP